MAHLVHLAGLFGINENRARVALSRMVAAGEATTDGSGRYRLAGHLLDRQGRQTGSRTGQHPPVGGDVAAGGGDHVGPVGRRARWPAAGGWPWPGWPSSAKGCGCGPTTSTWCPIRPTIPMSTVFTGHPGRRPGGAGRRPLGPRRVGRAGPGPARPAGATCRRPDPADLAPGFELSAAVLRHLQADPLLPADAPARRTGRARRCGTPTTRWDRRYRRCSGRGAGPPDRRVGPTGRGSTGTSMVGRYPSMRPVGVPRTDRPGAEAR